MFSAPRTNEADISLKLQRFEDATQNPNIKFLNEMIFCYNRNTNRSKKAYRYTTAMKLFTAYIRMIGGEMLYETFHANNSGAVPSKSLINRFIRKTKCDANEGVIRSEELLEYLNKHKLPKLVALSEDATRITARIQYCSRTNEIVGFPLPLDENSMPIPGYYKARTAAEIENHFYDVATETENRPACYVNVVMAHSLVRGIPPFCLLIFGSDNKYTSTDVDKRWTYICGQLLKQGIKVVTFASDSDPKFNAVMKKSLQLGCDLSASEVPTPPWFNSHCNLNTDYFPIQDVIHIGTKFRNKILNHSLKFGKHKITIDHLQTLLKTVTKERHKLTDALIRPTDKQHFPSVLKICDENTIDLLNAHVKESHGTVFYLRIMNRILRAFLDLTLTPLERIRNMWFANFMLRIWRSDIIGNKQKTKDNFITFNCYSCVEINCHSLVLLCIYLKSRGLDHLFCPEFFSSQPCEAIFRQIRSLSSTYSTVTNASLLEIIQKMGKIELQNDIIYNSLRDYNFPRIGVDSSSYFPMTDRNGNHYKDHAIILPSVEEIWKEIEYAKLEAEEYAKSLGITVPNELKCFIKNINPPSDYTATEPTSEGSETEIVNINTDLRRLNINSETDDLDMLKLYPDINLTEYENKKKLNAELITENSPFVKVRNAQGREFYVSKHTLVWLLSKTTTKLSSDRVRRVMTRSN